MNENKIAFIICYNDELYMSECVRYINRLNIPGGVKSDIIGIQDADSMCAGYNAAMIDSDAKYKVYMHQDVFILNENFIADIIKVFRENPDYGLLGMVGTERYVKDGDYVYAWDEGVFRGGRLADEFVADVDVEKLTQMEAVDGMMLATQYDLPWREDVFHGFDFYDISQCMEFRKAGYKVGVPHQGFPWCLHDCGVSNVVKYDRYRRIFCDVYRELGYEFAESEHHKIVIELDKMLKENAGILEQLIEAGEVETARGLLKNFSDLGIVNNEQVRYTVICDIIYREKQAGAHDFYNDETNKIPDLVAKLTRYKFFLRRVEQDILLDDDEVLAEIAARTDKRLTDLCELALHVTLEPKETIHRLVAMLG
jgi:hypothetical protein